MQIGGKRAAATQLDWLRLVTCDLIQPLLYAKINELLASIYGLMHRHKSGIELLNFSGSVYACVCVFFVTMWEYSFTCNYPLQAVNTATTKSNVSGMVKLREASPYIAVV